VGASQERQAAFAERNCWLLSRYTVALAQGKRQHGQGLPTMCVMTRGQAAFDRGQDAEGDGNGRPVAMGSRAAAEGRPR
jgi:hypothetical protein